MSRLYLRNLTWVSIVCQSEAISNFNNISKILKCMRLPTVPFPWWSNSFLLWEMPQTLYFSLTFKHLNVQLFFNWPTMPQIHFLCNFKVIIHYPKLRQTLKEVSCSSYFHGICSNSYLNQSQVFSLEFQTNQISKDTTGLLIHLQF